MSWPRVLACRIRGLFVKRHRRHRANEGNLSRVARASDGWDCLAGCGVRVAFRCVSRPASLRLRC